MGDAMDRKVIERTAVIASLYGLGALVLYISNGPRMTAEDNIVDTSAICLIDAPAYTGAGDSFGAEFFDIIYPKDGPGVKRDKNGEIEQSDVLDRLPSAPAGEGRLFNWRTDLLPYTHHRAHGDKAACLRPDGGSRVPEADLIALLSVGIMALGLTRLSYGH